VAQERRPDKQLYRLTDQGRARLAAWVEQVEDDPDGRPGAPDAVAAQLRACRALLERRVAPFEAIEAGLTADEPRHSRVAPRHGIVRARATLTWAEESERELLGAVAP
jgi:DNA-binding PadR family transcriptional regulator